MCFWYFNNCFFSSFCSCIMPTKDDHRPVQQLAEEALVDIGVLHAAQYYRDVIRGIRPRDLATSAPNAPGNFFANPQFAMLENRRFSGLQHQRHTLPHSAHLQPPQAAELQATGIPKHTQLLSNLLLVCGIVRRFAVILSHGICVWVICSVILYGFLVIRRVCSVFSGMRDSIPCTRKLMVPGFCIL